MTEKLLSKNGKKYIKNIFGEYESFDDEIEIQGKKYRRKKKHGSDYEFLSLEDDEIFIIDGARLVKLKGNDRLVLLGSGRVVSKDAKPYLRRKKRTEDDD